MDKIITENEWRISKSGFSIKTGWNDDKKIIANCPVSITVRPFDNETFSEWMDNAELICTLYNNHIKNIDEITSLRARVAELEARDKIAHELITYVMGAEEYDTAVKDGDCIYVQHFKGLISLNKELESDGARLDWLIRYARTVEWLEVDLELPKVGRESLRDDIDKSMKLQQTKKVTD